MRLVLFGSLLTFAAGMTWAAWTPGVRFPSVRVVPQVGEAAFNTWSGCLRHAASQSGVDPALLHAIVIVESGEHPYAFGWNDEDGRRRLYKAATYSEAVSTLDQLDRRHLRFDIGLAQVNSRNLKVLETRTGVPAVRALDPCTNLKWAATILREQIRVHGATWRAVAGYNGAMTYAAKVHRVYCREVPEGAGCRPGRPLSALLCDPLPVTETGRYYHPFKRFS